MAAVIANESARVSAVTAALSAMSQSGGYALAAVGPVAVAAVIRHRVAQETLHSRRSAGGTRKTRSAVGTGCPNY